MKKVAKSGVPFPLSLKAVLGVFLILFPIAFTFVRAYYKNDELLRSHALNDLSVTAAAYEGLIYKYLDGVKQRAVDFSSDGFIRESLKRIIEGDTAASAALAEHLRRNKIVLDDTIEGIVVLSAEGEVAASTYDHPLRDGDLSGQEFFVRGLIGPYVSETEAYHPKGPVLAVSAPVVDRSSGRTLGVLVNFISIGEINKLIRNSLTGFNDAVHNVKPADTKKRITQEVYLVNRDRLMITDSMFLNDVVLKQVDDSPLVTGCIESKKEMAAFYRDYRGVPVAGASVCIEPVGWTLVVKADTSEVLAPSRLILREAAVTSLIVALMIIGLLAGFMKVVVRPIRALFMASKRLASGEYGVRVPVTTSDEIGALAASFNTMSGEIRAREEKLKENEERYRYLVENINEVVYSVSLDGDPLKGTVEFVSARAGDILGYSPEDFKKDPGFWFSIIHPDDRESVRASTERMVETRSPVVREYRVRPKGGGYIWIEDRVQPVFDSRGRLIALHGTASDVTERKRAEEAVRRSEERLREAQHIARLGNWEWDVKTGRVYRSDEVFRIFGRPKEEFQGSEDVFFEAVHPDDRDYVRRAIENALKNKDGLSMEYRIVIPGTGKIKYLHSRGKVELDERGEVSKVVGTVQDVTELKAAEEAVRRSEERLREAQHIARLGNWEWNIKEDTIYWSDEVYVIFGVNPEGFKPSYEAFLNIVHPDDRDLVRRSVDDALKRRKQYDIDHRVVLPDGSVRTVHVRANVTFDSSGSPEKMTGTVQDITERVLMEKALRESEEKYRAIVESSSECVCHIDTKGRFLYMNPAGLKLNGFDRAKDVVGVEFTEGVLKEFVPSLIEAFKKALKGGTTDLEYCSINRKGRKLWWSSTIGPVMDGAGRVESVLVLSKDITAAKRAEDEVRERQRRIARQQAAIVRIATMIPHLAGDRDAFFRQITETAAEVLGVERAGVWLLSEGGKKLELATQYERSTQRHWGGMVLEAGDYPLYFAALQSGRAVDAHDALNDPRVSEFRRGYLEPFGIASMLDAPIRLGGRVIGVLCCEHVGRKRRWRPDEVSFVADMADRVAEAIMEAGRRKAEVEMKKLSTAIEHRASLVFITDYDGKVEYVNPLFRKVTGYSDDEVKGRDMKTLFQTGGRGHLFEQLWNTVRSGRIWRGEIRGRKKSGGYYLSDTVVTPIVDEKGFITNFLVVQEDVTEKTASARKIERLASYDTVTGLYNRTRFISELDGWIGSEGTEDARGALMLLDLDHFKLINDTFGHGTGDAILRRVAGLLNSLFRSRSGPYMNTSGDIIAGRLSSDEFAVFVPGLGAEEWKETAEFTRTKIEELVIDEISGHITACIGVSLFPDHGTSTKELLARADAAMFRAKELGRNRAHLYRPEDRDLEQMHTRLKWKEKILKALGEDRFVPYFQPILDLRDGSIHHYEALARMEEGEGTDTILMPGDFISTAERFGLIGSIDRTIMKKAMLMQAETSKKGVPLSFAVNLSGKDLGDPDLLRFLSGAIEETGADPERMVFEITETEAVRDLEVAKDFVKELKSIGCLFSLDDFGVGFTSFVYLKEMDVDFVKIDGSFIKNLHRNANDQLFVKAIVDVAKGMGIMTVAEFVEEAPALEILKKFGVDYAQGYLIGGPTPALGPAKWSPLGGGDTFPHLDKAE